MGPAARQRGRERGRDATTGSALLLLPGARAACLSEIPTAVSRTGRAGPGTTRRGAPCVPSCGVRCGRRPPRLWRRGARARNPPTYPPHPRW